MSTSHRFNLAPLVRYHYAYYLDPGATRLTLSTRLVLFGIPLAVGLFIGLTAPVPEVSPLTIMATTAGTLTAGFLAAVVLLTNLRIKLQESPATLPQTAKLRRSVSMATISSVYLMLASATILLTAVGGSLYWGALSPVWASFLLGIMATLFTHVIVTSITVVRRAAGAYVNMFRGEVIPTRLHSVDDKDSRAS